MQEHVNYIPDLTWIIKYSYTLFKKITSAVIDQYSSLKMYVNM